MGLYFTIQHEDVVRKLSEVGKVMGNEQHVSPPFLPAYRWMVQRMKKRGMATTGFRIWMPGTAC